MKKILLIPALLLGTLAVADTYKYEISPLIGINSAEGNLGFNDNAYVTGGLELQMNTQSSKISPEFSLLYAPNVNYKEGGSTDVMRLMLNGVYSFDKVQTITPFAKAGVGMEYFTTNKAGNEDRPFIDAGVGLKAAITDKLALKVEALYMLKHGFTHAGSADSNLVTLFGFNYAFGADKTDVYHEVYKEESAQTQSKVQKEAMAPMQEETVQKHVIPPVEVIPVVKEETKAPQMNKFETQQQKKALDLHIQFKYKSTEVAKSSYATLQEYADFLKKHSEYRAKIIGYTDNIGSAKYNKKLSKKRADSVVKLLIEDGVNPSQLIAVGMGEANPIADNATEAGRAQNRRIEAELIK